MPLALVLHPHLTSLPPGFLNVEKEVRRVLDLEWYEQHLVVPFFPMICWGQGCVPRKLEDRLRRTSDLGMPRQPLSQDGVDIISLNTAIGIKATTSSGAPKWPKEVKPTLADAMQDGAVLLFAARRVFGEPVFSFTDDAKDFFLQFTLCWSELWKACFMWRRLEDKGRGDANPGDAGFAAAGLDSSDLGDESASRADDPSVAFIVELVLGFGGSASSNIAQRFASALVEACCRRFDREEDPLFDAMTDPRHQSWIRGRRALAVTTGRQELRLYAVHMYTDDPLFSVVGTDRCARLLRCWHHVTTSVNLLMAIEAKRQLGAPTWIGARFYANVGAIVVPEDKRVRALRQLQRVARGEGMPYSEYRSLVGLLQHLVFLVGSRQPEMYGLYAPHRQPQVQPRDPVYLDAFGADQVERWIRVLSHRAAAPFTAALRAGAEPADDDSAAIGLYSDAAKDGALVPSMAGFIAGLWWSIPLALYDLSDMPITPLELAALAVNVVVAQHLLGPQIALIAYSDSLSSIFTLVGDSASSPMMQFIHAELLRLPSFRLVQSRLSTAHVYGEANPGADLPSRGKFSELQELCQALGIRDERVDVPPEALTFLARVRERWNAIRAVEQGRGASRRDNSDGDGPPWYANPLVVPHTVSSARRNPSGAASPGTADAQTSQRPDTQPTRQDGSPLRGKRPRLSWVAPAELRSPPNYDPRRTSTRQHALPVWVNSAESRSLVTSPGAGNRRTARHDAVGPAETRPTRAVPSAATLSVRGASPAATPSVYAVVVNAVSSAALVDDASCLALKPRHHSLFQDLIADVGLAAQHGLAPRTRHGDEGHWRRWETFCRQEMATPPLRDDADANSGRNARLFAREVQLMCLFLVWVHRTMAPRSNSRTDAKPQSAMNVLLAVRRVHKLAGYPMASSAAVTNVLKGLCRAYVLRHGPEAMTPARKEPLSRDLFRRLMTLANGTPLGPHGTPLNWSDPLWISVSAACATAKFTGVRKAEIAGPHDKTKMNRASLRWRIGGRVLAAPTPSELRALQPGDAAVLAPATAKNDPFGLHFGNKPMWLPFDNVPTNAANRLRSFELAFPIEPSRRSQVPLFVSDMSFAPLTHSTLDKALSDLLTAVVGPTEARRFSFHSFRIALACELLAAGASPGVIQALARWRSPAALDAYARLNPEDYARWLIKASQANASSILVTNLPVIDADTTIASLQTIAGQQPAHNDAAGPHLAADVSDGIENALPDLLR